MVWGFALGVWFWGVALGFRFFFFFLFRVLGLWGFGFGVFGVLAFGRFGPLPIEQCRKQARWGLASTPLGLNSKSPF